MNMDCRDVRENYVPHQNSDLSEKEKAGFKRHVVECSSCQAEYEELLHTAALLESLPEPLPPLNLAERIQLAIRRNQRRQAIWGFLTNPVARLLVAMRLGPHPTFVNYTAMLFYLMLTVFLVKLTFFNEPPVTVTRPLSPQVRVMTLGGMKRAVLNPDRIEGEKPPQIPLKTETTTFDLD